MNRLTRVVAEGSGLKEGDWRSLLQPSEPLEPLEPFCCMHAAGQLSAREDDSTSHSARTSGRPTTITTTQGVGRRVWLEQRPGLSPPPSGTTARAGTVHLHTRERAHRISTEGRRSKLRWLKCAALKWHSTPAYMISEGSTPLRAVRSSVIPRSRTEPKSLKVKVNFDVQAAFLTVVSAASLSLLSLLCLRCRRKTKIIQEENVIYDPQTFETIQESSFTEVHSISSTPEHDYVSRLAPPPVLTWLTLSSVFHLAQQVAVSPPPGQQGHQRRPWVSVLTGLLLLDLLTDDCDAARLGHLHHLVHEILGSFGEVIPLEDAHGAVPHDLLGPAHSLGVGLGALRSTVQTLWGHHPVTRAPAYVRTPACTSLSGPLTIQPAGMPAATVAIPVAAFSSNLSAVTKSTGRVILTPFFSALAIKSLTMPAPSSSYREVPICKISSNKKKRQTLYSGRTKLTNQNSALRGWVALG
ncbi:unnamed protein product [Menidia menidia]|uniref:(Atlantic silverside) hypothetical protein n=1 Tax=Menidia menidia TaxID=238744 RepID=A0A8S4AH62_9TELE|nr:unnamed protein product [Menidia menidia]